MTRERTPRSFAVMSIAVLLLAAGAIIASQRAVPVVASPLLAVLLLFVVVAEAMAVDLPRGGSMSLAYPLTIAVVVLMGPTAGALVAAASGFSVDDLRKHKQPTVVAFNISQLALSALVSGWLYALAGGPLVLGSPITTASAPRVILPALLLGTSSFLANALFASVGMALLKGLSFRQVFLGSFSWAMPAQLSLAVLGMALAEVVALIGVLGLLLFVFPLVIARQMYQRYLGLRDAYLDTIRSLVAAIEAKDPYTRGHSERVAGYAVQLAQAMHLPDQTVERIEFSALLHDLGKIGISTRILSKAAPLTFRETEEIRRHPAIGASILARVPYLGDVVPAVVSHHERYDGLGYGDGLVAEAAPLDARILAVADSYDAMTSERPYRPALTRDEAMSELHRESGRQFDPLVVERFTELMGAPCGVTALDLRLAVSIEPGSGGSGV